MFRSIAFLSAVSAAAAGKATPLEVDSEIKSSSRLGKKILSHARQLSPERKLDNDDNFSWVTSYSIKFVKCATSDDYYGGYFGGEENENQNQNQNQGQYYYGGNGDGQQNNQGMYQQRLIHFQLCPTGSCSSGSSSGCADYVIDMNLFVQSYIVAKMELQQQNCELVAENCYCNDDGNNNGYNCQYACFQQAGLDYCGEYMDGGNNGQNGEQEFNLAEAAECSALEVNEDALQYYYYKNGGTNQQNGQYYGNNNNGEMELFVGPYCSSNGKKIFLGVFMDETCSYPADNKVYESVNYGQALPYSKESLISNECMSCKEPSENDYQNYYDQQDEDEVLEICESLYEDSGKCESNLNNYYKNEQACTFISTLKASGGKGFSAPTVNMTPKVLAGIFAATTVAFGGVAYFMHQKLSRKSLGLSQQGGAMA